MTVKLVRVIQTFIGQSGDTKPTGVPVGSRYLETDTDKVFVTTDTGTTWVQIDTLVVLQAGDNNIGNVDIVTLPAGNLGQQASAASLSVTPATDVADATYIGDIKFGEALPAGVALLGTVGIDQTTPGTTNLVAVSPSTGSLTDRSGSIAVAATSQQLAAANASRKYLLVKNTSSAQLWFNFGVAAVQAQPSIPLEAGEAFVMEAGFLDTQAVNIIGPAGGETFTAKEG